MVKLHTKNKAIHVSDMKDGQIAVILSWNNNNVHIGSIVQRDKYNLVNIGHGNGNSWPNIFTYDNICTISKDKYADCLVRVLEKGELIEIC